MLLTNLAGHLGQWTASIFNAYSSPLSHWSCQSTWAVSSCHTPATTQMYSDTDYVNLYLVSPPNTCIRSLLLYWSWDMCLSARKKFFFINLDKSFKVLYLQYSLHSRCHIKESSNEKHTLILWHMLWIFAEARMKLDLGFLNFKISAWFLKYKYIHIYKVYVYVLTSLSLLCLFHQKINWNISVILLLLYTLHCEPRMLFC